MCVVLCHKQSAMVKWGRFDTYFGTKPKKKKSDYHPAVGYFSLVRIKPHVFYLELTISGVECES